MLVNNASFQCICEAPVQFQGSLHRAYSLPLKASRKDSLCNDDTKICQDDSTSSDYEVDESFSVGRLRYTSVLSAEEGYDSDEDSANEMSKLFNNIVANGIQSPRDNVTPIFNTSGNQLNHVKK